MSGEKARADFLRTEVTSSTFLLDFFFSQTKFVEEVELETLVSQFTCLFFVTLLLLVVAVEAESGTDIEDLIEVNLPLFVFFTQDSRIIAYDTSGLKLLIIRLVDVGREELFVVVVTSVSLVSTFKLRTELNNEDEDDEDDEDVGKAGEGSARFVLILQLLVLLFAIAMIESVDEVEEDEEGSTTTLDDFFVLLLLLCVILEFIT